MTTRRSARPLAALLILLCAAGIAQAQSDKPPQPEPKPTPAHEPTLDELLGLPNAKPAESAKPAEGAGESAKEPLDPAKAELERQLNPTEIAEAFEQAVALMGQTADRLDTSHDTGLGTQRMQEDILRKLDTLIDQAKKQQSSKSKNNKKQDQQQQQQQQQQSSQQNSKTNDPQKGGGPDKMEGAVHAAPGATAAWGNLPEHVRNALVEGTSEHFSSLYKTITEKYYKRLAEEPKGSDAPLAPTSTTPTPAPAPTPSSKP